MVTEPITIHLEDIAGVPHMMEPVQSGVPFPKGILTPDCPLSLSDCETGETLDVQTHPLAHWPDGSIRWLRVNFVASLAPYQKRHLQLSKVSSSNASPVNNVLHCEIDDDVVRVGAAGRLFHIPADKLCWSTQKTDGFRLEHKIRLIASDGSECDVQTTSPWHLTEHGPVCVTLKTTGSWLKSDKSRLADFDCRLSFYANSHTAKLEVSIHNPCRARHPGGLWDLGDAGSEHFRSLTVEISHPDSEEAWLKPVPVDEALSITTEKSLLIYQDSSGGENWQSRNHSNAEGNTTVRFRGYRTQVDSDTVDQGNRAQPICGLSGQFDHLQACIQKFWENFPSSLGTANHDLIIGLFPENSAEPYELQGGERKRQTAWFNYSEDKSALAWSQAPLIPTLDATHYEQTGAFPWFRANQPEGSLEHLIKQGVDGPNNFFAKREVIDEYGWRHFGDIFADHETLYQQEDEAPFISHYNNQYDAIFGFARQFALSGDRRWFSLMDDLASHVVDIDIYHTSEDRGEYNGGLFWHTDHYLDCQTATHRTFSKNNSFSSTPGQTGGGPGSEHCYSTGLLYHYYLTGCEFSKEAVIELARWITTLHEGANGFFEQLLVIKRTEIPNLKALIKGNAPSIHTYPFTRGTGNYLNTLLDAYLLEENNLWLQQTEQIIKSTIHPLDDLTKRDLLDVENRWSYLVLLTSISRYLLIKRELRAFDNDYWYAFDSFIHYIDWMVRHERPFLEDSTQLEFPNDTWTAQDIRKAMLMFQAASFQTPRSKLYTEKGWRWLNQVCDRLETSREASYARILVILMQNHGPHQSHLSSTEGPLVERTSAIHDTPPTLSWGKLVRRILRRIFSSIRTLSIKTELNWLSSRLGR